MFDFDLENELENHLKKKKSFGLHEKLLIIFVFSNNYINKNFHIIWSILKKFTIKEGFYIVSKLLYLDYTWPSRQLNEWHVRFKSKFQNLNACIDARQRTLWFLQTRIFKFLVKGITWGPGARPRTRTRTRRRFLGFENKGRLLRCWMVRQPSWLKKLIKLHLYSIGRLKQNNTTFSYWN